MKKPWVIRNPQVSGQHTEPRYVQLGFKLDRPVEDRTVNYRMTPDDARRLAASLVSIADAVEGK